MTDRAITRLLLAGYAIIILLSFPIAALFGLAYPYTLAMPLFAAVLVGGLAAVGAGMMWAADRAGLRRGRGE